MAANPPIPDAARNDQASEPALAEAPKVGEPVIDPGPIRTTVTVTISFDS